ncbi:MAG: HAD family hydrolase [Firmicutes bacterium]|nr:HAD family hydrolase [Bacillota bacterium]
MIKAILFDLDGTLLPMDMEVFTREYFKGLTGDFCHLYDPSDFQKYIWQATKAMVKDSRPETTNEEVFMENFFPLVNHREEELMPMFDQFYTKKFIQLDKYTNPTPLARKIVSLLADKGYKLALATNPVFPMAATSARMRWAGIDDLPWEIVTTYEHSHFCKPNPGYFAEIIEQLGIKPHQALMVGNDTMEDLVASKLGIKTYLATDCLIDRGDSPFKPDASGTLKEFYQLAQTEFAEVF